MQVFFTLRNNINLFFTFFVIVKYTKVHLWKIVLNIAIQSKL